MDFQHIAPSGNLLCALGLRGLALEYQKFIAEDKTLDIFRVINAGKSTHNEDQGSCQVVTVKKKTSAPITPSKNSAVKRRSSLPNGEGLQSKDNSESEGISFNYWALFDGHAGTGAAIVASKLLHHKIAEHLQEVTGVLRNSAVQPPTCLTDESEVVANTRTLTRAASLRGSMGTPGSPSSPPTRFFIEKKIAHEGLVIGAIENAFQEMVSVFMRVI
ncbi:protein phosphatase 1H-like [Narcine bancroftii]|uniref:protein phosphatase 1H-like n=1 Tax=Narcine bancroftii TaxID=1343680 RepID=UPI003831A18E